MYMKKRRVIDWIRQSTIKQTLLAFSVPRTPRQVEYRLDIKKLKLKPFTEKGQEKVKQGLGYHRLDYGQSKTEVHPFEGNRFNEKDFRGNQGKSAVKPTSDKNKHQRHSQRPYRERAHREWVDWKEKILLDHREREIDYRGIESPFSRLELMRSPRKGLNG